MSKRLDEIEARVAAASQGPWVSAEGRVLTEGLLDPENPKRGREIIAEYVSGLNMPLIASARTDVPYLLAIARAAERLLNLPPRIELKDGVDAVIDHYKAHVDATKALRAALEAKEDVR